MDPRSGRPVSNYTLLYYFEAYRGGDRQYSQVFTEVVESSRARATSAQGAAHAALPRSRPRSREIR